MDAGEYRSTHYLAMEYVDGTDLSRLLRKKGPAPLGRALGWLLQAADALVYAHEHGVVHRDIKPANMLLDTSGTIKILDMGLARFESVDGEELSLTVEGGVLGTAEYMAPEQARNAKEADELSDVYALGATLYRLTTGQFLFGGSTLTEKLLAIQNDPLPRFEHALPGAPKRLHRALEKMLAKAPGDRFASMAETRDELRACLELIESIPGAAEVTYSLDDAGDTLVSSDASMNSMSRFLSRMGSTLKRLITAGGSLSGAPLDRQRLALVGGTVVLGAVACWLTIEAYRGSNDPPKPISEPPTEPIAKGPAPETTIPEPATPVTEPPTPVAENTPAGTENSAAEAPAPKPWVANANGVVLNLHHPRSVLAVAWDSTGQRLASATTGPNDRIKIWDVAAGVDVLTLKGNAKPVSDLAWSPDDSLLVSSSDGAAKIYDTETGNLFRVIHHPDNVKGVAWSPDGSRLATACFDGVARIWDPDSEELLLKLPHPDGAKVASVAWSPDGRWLGSTCEGISGAYLWDAVTGERQHDLKGHTENVAEMVWDPYSRRVATASSDRKVKIWDALTGREIQTLRAHGSFLLSVDWSPDGRYLASAGNDQLIIVWDTQTWYMHRTLKGQPSSVMSVKWRPDSHHLASGGWTGLIKIWEAVTTEQLGASTSSPPPPSVPKVSESTVPAPEAPATKDPIELLSKTPVAPYVSPADLERLWDSELAHFRFEGNLDDDSERAGKFEYRNIQMLDGALSLNGKLATTEWRDDLNLDGTGYLARFATPEIDPAAFTVAIRFKPDLQAQRGLNILLAGDHTNTWFKLWRSGRTGEFHVRYLGEEYHLPVNASMQNGSWMGFVFGVDLNQKKMPIFLNGQKPRMLPLMHRSTTGLKRWAGDVSDEHKVWDFTDQINTPRTFKGLIDELIVYDRALAETEINLLPIWSGN
jgi:WD40 repeat protein